MFLRVFITILYVFASFIGICWGGAALIGCYAPPPLKWTSMIWFFASSAANGALIITVADQIADIDLDRAKRWRKTHKTPKKLRANTPLNNFCRWWLDLTAN